MSPRRPRLRPHRRRRGRDGRGGLPRPRRRAPPATAGAAARSGRARRATWPGGGPAGLLLGARSSCSSTCRSSRSPASTARCSGRWRSPWSSRWRPRCVALAHLHPGGDRALPAAARRPDARSAAGPLDREASTGRCFARPSARPWCGGGGVGRAARASAWSSSCGPAASSSPQLDEGDLVVQTTRAAGHLARDRRLRGRQARGALLEAVPEVKEVVSRIGSPAVATDIMGLEQADVFVLLAAADRWRPGVDKDQLIADIERAHRGGATPAPSSSFTQPIQMRFNELLGGAVTDVTISVYGDDLAELRRIADADRRRRAGSARRRRRARARAARRLAARGRAATARRRAARASRSRSCSRRSRRSAPALEVGATYDGPLRVPILLRLGGADDAVTSVTCPLPARSGRARAAVARRRRASWRPPRAWSPARTASGASSSASTSAAPTSARSWRARAGAVAAQVKLPRGYRLEWGGQYETLQAAQAPARHRHPGGARPHPGRAARRLPAGSARRCSSS